MAGRDPFPRQDEDGRRSASETTQRLAGSGTSADPQRLETGGRRPLAEATRRRAIGPAVDDDGLNADQHR